MNPPSDRDPVRQINRREAIYRVSALLGGVAFVGGTGLLAAIEKASLPAAGALGKFTAGNIAFLDEIAETILPATKTPGAKAAQTGAFIALMVTDCYSPAEQKIFRKGMRKVNAAARKATGVSFMAATPLQRFAVLTTLDREQKRLMDAREALDRRNKGLASLPADPTDAQAPSGTARSEAAPVDQPATVSQSAPVDQPAHYFRMMKELTLLGYFTSEPGCTKAMRYIETPGRFDPCVPYTPGEPAWAAHA